MKSRTRIKHQWTAFLKIYQTWTFEASLVHGLYIEAHHVHCKLYQLLQNGARCSADLTAVHYRLEQAVSMVVLRYTLKRLYIYVYVDY